MPRVQDRRDADDINMSVRRACEGPRVIRKSNAKQKPKGNGNMIKNEAKRTKRHVIVGNQSYGLYYGETDATDREIVETKSVRLDNCRHIAHWQGKTGGITSLAAYGPCGPRAKESRIGAPAPSSLLSGVVNVYDCTDEAIKAFARIEVSGG
jgi:hypothetical protein